MAVEATISLLGRRAVGRVRSRTIPESPRGRECARASRRRGSSLFGVDAIRSTVLSRPCRRVRRIGFAGARRPRRRETASLARSDRVPRDYVPRDAQRHERVAPRLRDEASAATRVHPGLLVEFGAPVWPLPRSGRRGRHSVSQHRGRQSAAPAGRAGVSLRNPIRRGRHDGIGQISGQRLTESPQWTRPGPFASRRSSPRATACSSSMTSRAGPRNPSPPRRATRSSRFRCNGEAPTGPTRGWPRPVTRRGSLRHRERPSVSELEGRRSPAARRAGLVMKTMKSGAEWPSRRAAARVRTESRSDHAGHRRQVVPAVPE